MIRRGATSLMTSDVDMNKPVYPKTKQPIIGIPTNFEAKGPNNWVVDNGIAKRIEPEVMSKRDIKRDTGRTKQPEKRTKHFKPKVNIEPEDELFQGQTILKMFELMKEHQIVQVRLIIKIMIS